MEKWDTFTELLKEYYLEGLYNNIYMKRNLEKDNLKPMRKIILETSEEWRAARSYIGKEIINKVIETIKNEEMKEQIIEYILSTISISLALTNRHSLGLILSSLRPFRLFDHPCIAIYFIVSQFIYVIHLN